MSPHFVGLINFCFLCWLLWLRVSIMSFPSKSFLWVFLAHIFILFCSLLPSAALTHSLFFWVFEVRYWVLSGSNKVSMPSHELSSAFPVSCLGTRDSHRPWAMELKPVLLLLFLKGSDKVYFHFHLILIFLIWIFKFHHSSMISWFSFIICDFFIFIFSCFSLLSLWSDQMQEIISICGFWWSSNL